MATTEKMLQNMLNCINRKEGRPELPYVQEGDKCVPQPGCLHLSGAYGGWKVDEMCESGGVRNASEIGFVSKKELYIWMSGRYSAKQYEGSKQDA